MAHIKSDTHSQQRRYGVSRRSLSVFRVDRDSILAEFLRFDEEKLGVIDRTMLIHVLKAIGKDSTSEQVERLVSQFDHNGDGQIEYKEFLSWVFPPHLVLNFDVNKTLMMSDAVQNKSIGDVVNEVLADAAWGSELHGEWVLGVTEPSVLRPHRDGQELVSYIEWLSKNYPGSTNKKKRTSIAKVFTSVGQPGAALAVHAERLAEGLKLPNGAIVQIVPAFFELMASLKQERRSFTLCFRTFGEDLEVVTKELNLFCEGRHPLSPPGIVFDGSDGDTDYRVMPGDREKCGTFYRDSSSASIIWGTWWQPEKEPVPGIACYDGMQGIDIVSGTLEDIGVHLRSKWRKPGTIALRDYFLYWKKNDMTSLGGKPLFYKFSQNEPLHPVFFDDNIRFSDAHIIHPVDMMCPDRKAWATPLLQTHLCRVEPLECIPDKQYFVKELARLELAFVRKLVVRDHLVKHLRRVAFALGKWEGAVRGEISGVEYDAWAHCRPQDRARSLLSQAEEAELESHEV